MTTRILYGKPASAPQRVQATQSRMSDVPAEEGDIPAYFLWDDGSEYEVFEHPEQPGSYSRRYHGPLFNAPTWQTEVFGGDFPRTEDVA